MSCLDVSEFMWDNVSPRYTKLFDSYLRTYASRVSASFKILNKYQDDFNFIEDFDYVDPANLENLTVDHAKILLKDLLGMCWERDPHHYCPEDFLWYIFDENKSWREQNEETIRDLAREIFDSIESQLFEIIYHLTRTETPHQAKVRIMKTTSCEELMSPKKKPLRETYGTLQNLL